MLFENRVRIICFSPMSKNYYFFQCRSKIYFSSNVYESKKNMCESRNQVIFKQYILYKVSILLNVKLREFVLPKVPSRNVKNLRGHKEYFNIF